jgi:hypothetical protein
LCKLVGAILLIAGTMLVPGASTAQVQRDTVMSKWCGQYKGTLHIFGKNGKVNEVPMELVVAVKKPDTCWQWKITYGEGDEADVRDYELWAVDSARNYAYVLDEKDGIKLSFYFVSKAFYSFFEVNGTMLYTSYSIGKDRITSQIVTINPEKKDFEVMTEDEIHVSAFPLTGVQQAILRKQE